MLREEEVWAHLAELYGGYVKAVLYAELVAYLLVHLNDLFLAAAGGETLRHTTGGSRCRHTTASATSLCLSASLRGSHSLLCLAVSARCRGPLVLVSQPFQLIFPRTWQISAPDEWVALSNECEMSVVTKSLIERSRNLTPLLSSSVRSSAMSSISMSAVSSSISPAAIIIIP